MLYSNSMMVLKDEVSLTQGVRKSKIFIRKVLLLLVKLPNYTKSTVKYCDHWEKRKIIVTKIKLKKIKVRQNICKNRDIFRKRSLWYWFYRWSNSLIWRSIFPVVRNTFFITNNIKIIAKNFFCEYLRYCFWN